MYAVASCHWSACALNLANPIKLVLNLKFAPAFLPSSLCVACTTIPSLISAENNALKLSTNIKIPDMIKWITKTKHNATNQSLRDSLYFALSAAVELIKIRIPKYTNTDNSPTIAIFLKDRYQEAISYCRSPPAADSDASIAVSSPVITEV